MITSEEIKSLIENNIKDANIIINNRRQDNRHFEIFVESEMFKGKSLFEQHKMIHEALKSVMHTKLHGIEITTKIPEGGKNEQRIIKKDKK